jgi:hypothetical protein
MGPAQAPSHALTQAADSPALQPQTVTSHSLTLSTKAFSLDFTWRKVEIDQPEKRPALAGPAAEKATAGRAAVQYDRRARTISAPLDLPAPAQPQPEATTCRRSFAEVLRRQQLAGLVLMPSRPPADRQLLLTPTASADPQPGPVCRAYAEALGPLGGETSRFYTA